MPPKKRGKTAPPAKQRRSRLGYLVAFIPAAVFVGLIVFLLSQPPAAPPVPTVTTTGTESGVSAPDFVLRKLTPEGLSSETFTLSSTRGRVVFLEFSWWRCPHCAAMSPVVKELYSEFSGRGVVFLTVMVDDGRSDVSESARFVAEHGITWTALWDEGNQVARLYGVSGTPTYVVIDRDGSIVRVLSGGQPKQALSSALNSALG